MKIDISKYMTEDEDGGIELHSNEIITDMRVACNVLHFMNYVMLRLGLDEDLDFEEDDEEEFELDEDIDYGESLPLYFAVKELSEIEEMYIEERYKNMIEDGFGFDFNEEEENDG